MWGFFVTLNYYTNPKRYLKFYAISMSKLVPAWTIFLWTMYERSFEQILSKFYLLLVNAVSTVPKRAIFCARGFAVAPRARALQRQRFQRFILLTFCKKCVNCAKWKKWLTHPLSLGRVRLKALVCQPTCTEYTSPVPMCQLAHSLTHFLLFIS